ncbi:MAG: LysM peptidoglycan-binding domain-containing protein [Candidatus Saccharibacteria bacterium]
MRQRRTIRYGLLVGNFILLAGILTFTLYGSNASGAANPSALAIANGTTSNPLDQLSSADIALNLSRSVNLPETTAVKNQAETVNAEIAVTASYSVVDKPQIVATTLKTRHDVKSYLVKDGDTVTSIAAQFNVTSDSVRGSNNLTGDSVTVGAHLLIPPVNGVVYTVQSGDNAASLANKFSASADQITTFNDAEITGLQPGEQIVVPNGQVKQAVYRALTVSYGFSFGGSPIYGSNGYDPGFCTWYVANRVAVPSNWGNANTWDNLAPLSGWTVSSVPRQGAIGQTDRGSEGHVAYVEAVSADGTQIKYSDMNGLAGFNHVGYSGWVSASTFPHYIYR